MADHDFFGNPPFPIIRYSDDVNLAGSGSLAVVCLSFHIMHLPTLIAPATRFFFAAAWISGPIMALFTGIGSSPLFSFHPADRHGFL